MLEIFIRLVFLVIFVQIIDNCLGSCENLRQSDNNNGTTLFLTQYITSGRIAEGRKLAKVGDPFEGESYSGYLTVRNKYNANLFFWFFPAVKNPTTAPLLVWLQGGPGATSLFAFFVENGPYRINTAGKLTANPFAWTTTYSVIYFDSPVGTGFSFADNRGYVKTTQDAAADLYVALTQFFTLFPEYVSRDFYITGESYAGKYIPALASKIHRENQRSSQIRIKLKGIAIGNGLIDPICYAQYANVIYNFGLIDERQRKLFQSVDNRIKLSIKTKQWRKCFELYKTTADGASETKTLLFNTTGYIYPYNALQPTEPLEFNYFVNFVDQPSIRRAIHVGSNAFSGLLNLKVYNDFAEDFCQSAVPWLVEILEAREGYKVLLYSGSLDIVISTIGTELALGRMIWSGSSAYAQAPKNQWRVGKNQLGGYVRKGKNLTFVVVLNSGHVVPYDQARASFDMLNRFL